MRRCPRFFVQIEEGTSYQWPEQEAGIVPRLGATAIALSGGGTRALSAASGQLRTLYNMRVGKKRMIETDYISSVSGGTWTAAIFTFYRSGAQTTLGFSGMGFLNRTS